MYTYILADLWESDDSLTAECRKRLRKYERPDFGVCNFEHCQSLLVFDAFLIFPVGNSGHIHISPLDRLSILKLWSRWVLVSLCCLNECSLGGPDFQANPACILQIPVLAAERNSLLCFFVALDFYHDHLWHARQSCPLSMLT